MKRKNRKHVTAVSFAIQDIGESLNTLREYINTVIAGKFIPEHKLRYLLYFTRVAFCRWKCGTHRVEKDTQVQLSNGAYTSEAKTRPPFVIW